MGVEAADLEAALEVIEAKYGSIDAYMEQVLGVDDRKREVFAARFLGA